MDAAKAAVKAAAKAAARAEQSVTAQALRAGSVADFIAAFEAAKPAPDAPPPSSKSVASFLSRCGATGNAGTRQAATDDNPAAQTPTVADGIGAWRWIEGRWGAQCASTVLKNERVATQLIRLHSEQGDLPAAERLLDGVADPRRRSFTPLLDACAAAAIAGTDGEAAAVATARRVWTRMCPPAKVRTSPLEAHSIARASPPPLELTEAEYLPMMWCLRHEDGGAAVDGLMSSFARSTTGQLSPEGAESFMTTVASMSNTADAAVASVTEADIDPESGRCECCGQRLTPVALPLDTMEELMDKVTTLVPVRAKDKFNAFKRHLEMSARDSRTRPTIILDGANIGYYAVGGKGATKPAFGMDYPLLEDLMRQCRALGHRPLLFLHERHVEDKNVPRQHRELVRAWHTRTEYFASARGLNDDLCWLYASLYLSHLQATSGRAATEAPVRVVTGDKMRDHHFGMLSPKAFGRWRQVHQQHITRTRDHKAETTVVRLVDPAPYSLCAQRAPDPLVPEVARWHVPVVMDAAEAPPGAAPSPEHERVDDDGDGLLEDASAADVEASERQVAWLCVGLPASSV